VADPCCHANDISARRGVQSPTGLSILFSDNDDDGETMFQRYVCVRTQVSAYCYNGECRTHQSQCRLWWGDKADKAHDICYTELNDDVVQGGNCGFNFTSDKHKPCSSRYV